MTGPRPDLFEVALRHSNAEGNFDLKGTLETLEGEPVYELFPVGKAMVGMDRARRYYEHYFAEVAPRIASFRLVDRWLNENGVMEEYSITYKPDDGEPRTYRIMGLLKYGEKLLSGERIWACDELLKIMFLPLWDEMVPIRD